MNIFDDIKIYLPHYLSAESATELFEELQGFPNNIDKRFYSDFLLDSTEIYQGDGLRDIFVANIRKKEFKEANVIVVSNSCDISKSNPRFAPINMIYCPIIKLNRYKNYLKENKFDDKKIDDHIDAIMKQRLTSTFFLPKNENLDEDCFAFLDKASNVEVEYLDYEKISSNKLFSLSQYGHYMFLIKLSIHFTRLMENVDRNSTIDA